MQSNILDFFVKVVLQDCDSKTWDASAWRETIYNETYRQFLSWNDPTKCLSSNTAGSVFVGECNSFFI